MFNRSSGQAWIKKFYAREDFCLPCGPTLVFQIITIYDAIFKTFDQLPLLIESAPESPHRTGCTWPLRRRAPEKTRRCRPAAAAAQFRTRESGGRAAFERAVCACF